ncbi:glycoside hydrolase family 2 TIM barrel-domain containing protein [Nibricoccus sp. IMCC34717]|uniref:glycoside hydrolase family 2 TIM barrel-domain containing protein n=1 Tax=Nibricoccus sp. IMCC34717 TaxID=3034021 RepID=UPI00384B1071
MRLLVCCAVLLVFLNPLRAQVHRDTLSLDGEWEVAESVGGNTLPASYGHRAPVPGLTNLAQPAFADVDQFETREVIQNLVNVKERPPMEIPKGLGATPQTRGYFWYRTHATAPAERAKAFLRVGKAQFGMAAWVNGVPVGEYFGCYTSRTFDVTKAIRWGADNEVVVRIGAHPAMLPPDVPHGIDFEKLRQTPGIYDSVSMHFTGEVEIVSVQVAPRLAEAKAVVQTVLRNHGATRTLVLGQQVSGWRDRVEAGSVSTELILAAGEQKTVTQEVPITHARWWSPEDPYLYEAKTAVAGDETTTRFGMREFRFDTPTRRAYLNGKPIFLRGSNITLHRFFEDPLCGRLPWDEAWVRKLLVELPGQMHWNTFRFCIGPVPERWLEIADENGLLLQYEYFLWTGGKEGSTWRPEWDLRKLKQFYRDWMVDSWNHASVVIWDSCNETWKPEIPEQLIPELRKLDLSNRPWDAGYSLPSGPDDPIEDHPYLFVRNAYADTLGFRMSDLEQMSGERSTNAPYPSAHAVIINEYNWLWLRRDGEPPKITKRVFEFFGDAAKTAEGRFRLAAYLDAGLTEFWRAHRNAAGVLHFNFLTCSYPGVFTGDHFRDVVKLELEPNFLLYMKEAFKPLGVNVNFWREALTAGSSEELRVMLVNDLDRGLAGRIHVRFVRRDGAVTEAGEGGFTLAPLGQHTYLVPARVPMEPGDYRLEVEAVEDGAEKGTLSRRFLQVRPAGESLEAPKNSPGVAPW